MRDINDRDDFWKTISWTIIIVLVFMSLLANGILASKFLINNRFVDYEHPIKAQWDTTTIESGAKANLELIVDSYSVGQDKFYNYFRIPNILRIKLSDINILWLFLLLGLIYFVGSIITINDDDIELPFLFFTSILPQLILLFIVIFSSIVYYESPDLMSLGINDLQMSEQANSLVVSMQVETIVFMFLSMVVLDILVMLLGSVIIGALESLVSKIKANIFDKLALGNNIVLSCYNGYLELVSIDFELKWVPFPVIFLKKRVIDRFSASDYRNSKFHLDNWLNNLGITVTAENIDQLSKLNMTGELLLIRPDDNVSIIKLESAVEWKPLPKIVTHEEVVTQVSFDNFFRCLTTGSKQVALEELKNMLTTAYDQRFKKLGQEVSVSLVRHIYDKTLQVLKNKLPQIINQQNNLAAQEATRLLQELTNQKVMDYKQEVVASIGEVVGDKLGENIREQIIAPLRRLLTEQAVPLNNNASLDALPDGTKFFFSNGDSKIIIIEQKPQIRTLHFDDMFSGGSDGYYNLAFPYVIFMVVFSNDNFNKLMVYYNNKPMVNLEDQLFVANLPNIWAGSDQVCTGDFNSRANNFSQKVNNIISHFWQSTFNNDLDDNYISMASRGGVFKNLSSWQKASQGDPLFVLKVDWKTVNYRLSRLVFERLGNSVASKINHFDILIQRALKSEGLNIGELVRECCNNIRVDHGHTRKEINKIKQQIIKIVEEVSQSFQAEFSQERLSADEKDLMELVSKITAQAVEKVIAEDFNNLANQILLRRGLSSKELIDVINRDHQR